MSIGTLPETALMLVENDTVKGHFRNYGELAAFLDLNIDNSGQIVFRGKQVQPTYNLESFTKEEALRDWAKHHLQKNLPNGSAVYRYLTGC